MKQVRFKPGSIEGAVHIMSLKGLNPVEIRVNHLSRDIVIVCDDKPAPDTPKPTAKKVKEVAESKEVPADPHPASETSAPVEKKKVGIKTTKKKNTKTK